MKNKSAVSKVLKKIKPYTGYLILDDSFSALDFATDAALRKALAENTSGMTVIIVTQRCSTIMHADQIIVLDDGALAGGAQGERKEYE